MIVLEVSIIILLVPSIIIVDQQPSVLEIPRINEKKFTDERTDDVAPYYSKYPMNLETENRIQALGNALSKSVSRIPNLNQLTDHGPISINGDADFHSQAITEDWDLGGTRDGTKEKPYVIQGYNLTGYEQQFEILNTSLYYIFLNNYVKSNVSAPVWIEGNNGNFTYNTFTSEYSYQAVLVRARNLLFYKNNFTNSFIGLRIEGSDNIIANNSFFSDLSDRANGLSISSTKNTAFYNDFYDLDEGGILSTGTANIIAFNSMTNLGGSQLSFSAAIKAVGSNDQIFNNTILNHTFSGGAIRLHNAENNDIWNNQIVGNGITFENGIEIYGSYDNRIYRNQIKLQEMGIEIESSSYNNTIMSNYILDSNRYGLQSVDNAYSNIISSNTISSSSNYGTYISSSSNNNITWNNFGDNNGGGIQSSDSGVGNRFDSNYWNDLTTPDTDDNKFVDTPYDLSGSTSNQDLNPLTLPHNITNFLSIAPINDVVSEEDSINLQWDAAVDNYKHTIRYHIFFSLDGITWNLIVDNLVSTISYNWDISNEVNGTTYRIKVIAIGAHYNTRELISNVFTMIITASEEPTSEGESPTATNPGFEVFLALVSLVAVTILVRRRSRQ